MYFGVTLVVENWKLKNPLVSEHNYNSLNILITHSKRPIYFELDINLQRKKLNMIFQAEILIWRRYCQHVSQIDLERWPRNTVN